jgi:general stress protein 26
MYAIDDELKEFVESGVALAVATSDAEGHPHLAYAWGPRVHEDRHSMTVFVDSARAATTLGDLHATGRIAVVFGDPVSYRSVQLKGQATAIGETDAADEAWVQRHREAFLISTSLVGDPPAIIRNLWMQDVIRIDLTVEAAFDQTPGPDAGKPL